jgi:hypothetical protein
VGCCQIALLASGCGGDSGSPAPPSAAGARLTLSGVPARIPARYTCAGAGDVIAAVRGAVARGEAVGRFGR